MGEAMLFAASAFGDGTVALGPLKLQPTVSVKPGPVKVAVRPEAWLIDRKGAGVTAKLVKLAYLGSFYEYSFDTALGRVFVVSPDLSDVLQLGDVVGLSLAEHGVSVVPG